MNDAQLNQEIMYMSNFYGTLVATEGLLPKTREKCQKQLDRLIDSLEKATNHLIEANSGLTIAR